VQPLPSCATVSIKALLRHHTHFPTPLRYTEKQQFYWNWATLPLQSSSLQSPKFNVDKPTQWPGQRGSITFDLPAILQKRGYFRTIFNKMIYKTTDSQVFTLKKVCVLPNVESIFSAKSFGLGNLSLLTDFQKLSTVFNTVTIAHFY